jgi:hypothetical protein
MHTTKLVAEFSEINLQDLDLASEQAKTEKHQDLMVLT